MTEETRRIVEWLRSEANYARHAQATRTDGTEKLYRMGQKDGLLLAADAIARGDHAPSPSPGIHPPYTGEMK